MVFGPAYNGLLSRTGGLDSHTDGDIASAIQHRVRQRQIIVHAVELKCVAGVTGHYSRVVNNAVKIVAGYIRRDTEVDFIERPVSRHNTCKVGVGVAVVEQSVVISRGCAASIQGAWISSAATSS